MSNDEQRRYERAKVDIVVPWGKSAECHLMDRITSLSAGGCFLQTGHPAGRGEEVFIKFQVPEERTLLCEVRYHLERIGLGVAFMDLSEEEGQLLDRLVDEYRLASAQ